MPGRVEFVAMMSLLMGLIALGIGLMLPGLDEIATDLSVTGGSAGVAGIVTAYFLGLAAGQMVWGPLADRFGRKLALDLGLGVVVVGALASAAAPSLSVLLVTRVLWGLGASAARSTTLTVVRDIHSGDRMARLMSLIMSVFILVPVIAPTIGVGVLAVTSWRGMFMGVALVAVALLVWLRRLPETLRPEDVGSIAPRHVLGTVGVVLGNRITLGYLLALTSLTAAFTAYLSLAEPIIVGIYDLEALFPLVFGLFALGMAFASLANASVVERFGARRLVRIVIVVYTLLAGALVVAALLTDGVPSIWLFAPLLAVVLMSHAFMQANANSLAMDPMGRVAGLASAIIGAISLGVGTALGTIVQVVFSNTVTPVVVAFALSGLAALGLVAFAERGRSDLVARQVEPRPAPAR